MFPKNSPRRNFLWLGILIVTLAIISALASAFTFIQTDFMRSDTASAELSRTPPPIPDLTPERTTSGIGEKSFSLLVSFTDQGFEPSRATLFNDGVVRFTNNSTKPMRVSVSGYPSAGKQCDENTPDSCRELPPGEYWEFAFSRPGTWSVTEKLSGRTGVIAVED